MASSVHIRRSINVLRSSPCAGQRASGLQDALVRPGVHEPSRLVLFTPNPSARRPPERKVTQSAFCGVKSVGLETARIILRP
jgi:hypothetical protein